MNRRDLLVVGSALLASAGSRPASAAPASTEPVSIAIAVDGFQFTPLYIARANGYFQAEGVAVELVPSGGGAKAMTALLGASVQVSAAVASEVLNADNRGQNVLIFAALLDRPVMSVVLQGDVAKRLGITSNSPIDARLAALKGLRIGISSPKSASDSITRVIVQQARLSVDRDVDIVPTGGAADQIAAFLARKVDAITATSPSPEESIIRGGGVEMFDVAADVPLYRGYPWTIVSAKRDWLDANPASVRGLIRAFARAQRFVRENAEGARAVLRGVFPQIDDAVLAAACKRNFPAVAANPDVRLPAIATAFTEYKALNADPLTVTPGQISTNAYVEAALR
jgi:NitT/TauT family transport system substrate-binding protein